MSYFRLILLANLVAWPLAYLVMNRWFQSSASRIGIRPEIFVPAAGLTLLISLLTLSFQSVKAALSDPVETLRYE